MQKQLQFEQLEIDLLKSMIQDHSTRLKSMESSKNWTRSLHDMENKHWRGYFVAIVVAGFIGLVLGALIEILIDKTQPSPDKRWSAGVFMIVQLTLTFLLFYIIDSLDGYFGHWLLNSYAGYMFSLLYFFAQPQLAQNVATLIRF